ncbi:FliM/FliN family flagellar motor switch protein [Actibacterium sp. D379-3]
MNSALRRKVAPPVPDGRAARLPPTVAYVLARALARAAQEELELALSVTDVEESRPDLAALDAAVGEHALLVLLDGPAGAVGLAILSQPFLAAVVAQRMTGRMPAAQAAPRPPTRIDAEMARDLIDRTLAEADTALAAPQGAAGWLTGYRFRDALTDPRLLGFALADTGYHGVRMQLELPSGGGELFLALPEPPSASGTAPAPDRGEWGAALRGSVLAAELTVEAVLARIRLPLSQLAGLKAGDVLPLPGHSIGAVRLEGAGRALIASGRLGRTRGDRAVRLDGATATPQQKGAPEADAPEGPEPVAG